MDYKHRSHVLSLLVVSFLALPHAEASAAPSSLHVKAGQNCRAVRTFEPENISTAGDEGRLVLSPDGRSAYFHRVNENGVLVLFESHRRRGRWTSPVPVSFSKGVYNDLDPFVTPDGNELYFASDRADDGGPALAHWDIFKSERTATGWSEPVRLDSSINTADNELFPSLTWDRTLYFNSDRLGGPGAWDIYTAQWGESTWQSAVSMGPDVNTDAWEFNPSPSPDGSAIFFASMFRPDSAGGPDIYFAWDTGSDGYETHHFGACINTPAAEYHPTLSWRDGKLYFIRNSEGHGDVMQVPLLWLALTQSQSLGDALESCVAP